ncbi:Ig-like domain-containing protein [Aureibaculum sp. 2210JD6-5]|uniref:Ig-like domain-containing protein n=1 Tax=Aureibaculum sp. 2210JD6-5 TaxID=3103957 RepID=UPI002AAE1E3E|nr:Ig-like domain-containing protein [Aureibaculum sp. 2210JD6-5]MDY7394140.1 Ig-like domain-containing protein [Aureibaculum sp. 2210JD6-5]
MRKQFSVLFGFLFLVLFLTDCAKRGRPTGGEKDEDAPLLEKSIPANYSTNFKGKEIKLIFDEYVKLKDLNSQLIVSPPLKNNPLITPIGTASKTITIKLLDTLKENTTYSFNFGQSVTDNNEGNIFNNFKFVFSTGPIIDSLKVSGTISDSFKKEADENVTVMLYEINDAFNDSVIYKEKPYYVGNTLDSTIWEITNIKAGEYLLMALSDKSRNYTFNPKEDKIGFVKKHITVPSDTAYNIKLFKEILPFRLTRPSEIGKGHIQFGYEGVADSLKIEALNFGPDFKSVTNFEKEKDTLNYFYKGNSTDSIQFNVSNINYIDTVTVKLRTKKIDSLNLKSSPSNDVHFKKPYKIVSNTPLVSIDTTLINIINNDTIPVKHTVAISEDRSELILDFTKEYDKKYAVQILPNAITNFFGHTNDSLKYSITTKKEIDYGKLFVTLQGVKNYPIIVQLLTDKEKIVEEIYATEPQKFDFINLLPGKYLLRIIYDENQNKKWDTGNFLLKKQPEKVLYFEFDNDVRANWDIDKTFILE